MDTEKLQYSVLKNGQKKAFFSFSQLFKQKDLRLDSLCKTIAAMANSVGGEIFVGIEIKKSKFVAWEEQIDNFPAKKIFISLIQEQIQPPIQNLKIEDCEEGFAIQVPDSLEKPHILPNYKYYKRVLSKNQVMEEFEIRNLYQNSAKSNLKILNLSTLQGIPTMNSGKFEEMKFYPQIHIQNLGLRIEKDYKLEIAIPSALVDETFTVLHKYLKGYDLNKNVYSIPSTEALFQMEKKTVIELVIKVNADNFSVFQNSSISLKLYYTEGVHEQEYKLTEWFHYKGQLPEIENFTKKIEE